MRRERQRNSQGLTTEKFTEPDDATNLNQLISFHLGERGGECNDILKGGLPLPRR